MKTFSDEKLSLNFISKRTLGIINRDLDLAGRENFHLGLKCVRGAYIVEVKYLIIIWKKTN